MDTKLKNSISAELILVAGWTISTILLTCTKIYYSYWIYYSYTVNRSTFRSVTLVLLACSVGLLLLTLSCTVRRIDKISSMQEKAEYFFDRFPAELLAILIIFFGWCWEKAFFESDISVWERYAMYDLNGIVHVIWFLFWILLVLYTGIWLLVRQGLRGGLQKNSLVVRAVRRYKERTPMEKKLQHRKRFFLLLVMILFAAGAIVVGTVFYQWHVLKTFLHGNRLRVAIGLWCMCSALLLLGLMFYNRISYELGCLTERIRATAEGEPFEEKFRLTDRALLYEPFQWLEHIDVAMQKGVEKQMKAERLKVDLITNVSHDLKTPLTSMIGYTDLLKKEELVPEARDYVEVISAKQEQLKEMIQDLFELSKVTSGVGNLKLETLDMRMLLEQTLGDMEDRIRESGHIIKTDFDDEPLLFTGDNEKMYRVVQNLLENALKYSMEGTRIYLKAKRQGRYVRVEIKNIASYEMDFEADEIMERFVRGDKARTTEGHGLGLAIASGLVHNMGGSMELVIDGDLFKVILEFTCI